MNTYGDRRARFEDYWAVDIEKLRPNNSYDRMVEIRKERMKRYVNADGSLCAELVECVSCPICGVDECEERFHKEGFTFVQCHRCTLFYVNPCLKDEYVKEVYEHQSYSDIVRSLLSPSATYRRERFGTERVQIINRFARPDGRAGRVLDVGCATGFFLEAAQADGWEVFGVEANPYLADFAQNSGLEVRNERIEDTTFPPNFFDAITLFEVIEHVRHPTQILDKVHLLLRPGGVVFVYTPNFDCAERLIMGTKAHFIWGSNHLTYFTRTSLRYAFERCGFTVLREETQGLDVEDMIWFYENTDSYDMAFLKAFRHELQFLINSSGWGKNLRMYGKKRVSLQE